MDFPRLSQSSLPEGTCVYFHWKQRLEHLRFWRLDQQPGFNTKILRVMFSCFPPTMRLQASTEYGSNLGTLAWHGWTCWTTKLALVDSLGSQILDICFPPLLKQPTSPLAPACIPSVGCEVPHWWYLYHAMYPPVIQHSSWTWPFIVSCPIKTGDFL